MLYDHLFDPPPPPEPPVWRFTVAVAVCAVVVWALLFIGVWATVRMLAS